MPARTYGFKTKKIPLCIKEENEAIHDSTCFCALQNKNVKREKK
jgi:hypothetical protein